MFTVFAREQLPGERKSLQPWQTQNNIQYIDSKSDRTLLYAGSYDPKDTVPEELPPSHFTLESAFMWVLHEIGHALETRLRSSHLYPALYTGVDYGMGYQKPDDSLMTLEDCRRDVAAAVFSYLLVQQSRINTSGHELLIVPLDLQAIRGVTSFVGWRLYTTACKKQEKEPEEFWSDQSTWKDFALSVLEQYSNRNIHDEWQEICLDMLEHRQALSS